MMVMIVCDILFTDVVADAGAHAHPITQLSVPTGVKSRPKAFPLFWLVLISHHFKGMSTFCSKRNIVGNFRGFLDRVLTDDEVVTPEKCQ